VKISLYRKIRNSILVRIDFEVYEFSLGLASDYPIPEKISIESVTDIMRIDELATPSLVQAGFDFERDKKIVRRGGVLFYAKVNGELAHVTQIFSGKRAHRLYPLHFAMEYGHTVGLATFTAPNFRRMGIHTAVRQTVLSYLTKEGYKKAWDVQDANHNKAISKSILKMGYILWGRGIRLTIFKCLIIEKANKQFGLYFRK
jgi:hypothetical protein